jgi:hypothetical protein
LTRADIPAEVPLRKPRTSAGGSMRGIEQERMSYGLVRALALLIQLGAIICLTPLNRRSYPEGIAAFVALSAIAWCLNLYSRHSGEYQRRLLARHLRFHRYQEVLVSVLASSFALASVVYLQFLPTRPIFATAMFLGGCAGYALTNA